MLWFGDCLEVLKRLPAELCDSLVTDPPAGISFMGKEWDSDKGGRDAWIAWMTEVMREVYRVLKPGAHGLVWALPRTSHWTATALENAGFEIRDTVVHLFGTGFPKSLNIGKAIDKAAGAERDRIPGGQGGVNSVLNTRKPGEAISDDAITPEAKQWDGWGTALKPAHENWILIRKPLSEKTVAANVLRWGCGGLNIYKSRIPANNEVWEQEKNHCDSCVEAAKSSVKHTTLETAGSSAAANVALPAQGATHGSLLGDTLNADIGCYDATSEANTNTNLSMSTSGKNTTDDLSLKASLCITSTKIEKITESKICSLCGCPITFPIITSASQSGRFPSNLILSEAAAAELDAHSGICKSSIYANKGRNCTNFGVNAQPSGRVDVGGYNDTGGASRFFYVAKASKADKGADNKHPTVKSTKLMEYLIKLVTPPGGVVLDPFMGSGSTGVAAKDFAFIGIEMNREYLETAFNRIFDV